MWKILRDKAIGTAHEKLGLACQDAESSVITHLNGDEILYVCCSDGAGSAEFSEIGSNMAVHALWRAIETSLTSGILLQNINREQVLVWLRHVRDNLKQEAENRGIPIRSLACTILGGLIASECAVFFQVGDGGIVIQRAGVYEPVFWPQSGEYVNETNFVTDESSIESVEFMNIQERLDRVSLFTDGLQPLVLDYVKKTAHAPFFEQMFKSLSVSTLEDLTVPFHQFLNSFKVNERTDDDKTLILAIRVEDHA